MKFSLLEQFPLGSRDYGRTTVSFFLKRSDVEFLFNGLHLGITVGNFTGVDKLAISLLELLGKGLRQIVRALPGRNLADKLVGQVIGQCKGHLWCGHIHILPNFHIVRNGPRGWQNATSMCFSTYTVTH